MVARWDAGWRACLSDQLAAAAAMAGVAYACCLSGSPNGIEKICGGGSASIVGASGSLGEWMVARQNHGERLPCFQLVYEIGLLFAAEESDTELLALEVVGKHSRFVARNSDLNIEQFVSKEAGDMRQPIDFLSS